MSNLRKKNHYVSKSYLKPWSDENNQLLSYRILVSHNEVPLWQKNSIKSVAYHKHLYTLIDEEVDSDKIERWMDQKIETPAQKALDKVRFGEDLTSDELHCLVRFLALQDVRTPAKYLEHIKRCKKQMPNILEDVLQKAKRKLEEAIKTGDLPKVESPPEANMIPLKLKKEIEENSEQGYLKVEVLLGRSTWLFSIFHILNKTYRVLQEHNWSIIKAPDGIAWLTSDNPVIKLNYYGQGKYDFKGGWGNNGTEILFPLSPEYLMYTKVGEKKPCNHISIRLAKKIQRFIAEHAHRFIFSDHRLENIAKLRSRIIDTEAFKDEQDAWQNWHSYQRGAELDILSSYNNTLDKN